MQYIHIILFPKENALLLNSRKRVKCAIESLLGFQYLVHLWKMWCLDLIGYKPHRYLNSFLKKNLSQYSPIGAWLTIALVALVQSKFKCLKSLSHGLPLTIDSSIGLKLLSTSSRKCFHLLSEAWKNIFQLFTVLLYLFFLLKSQDNLHEKIRVRSNCFVSLLITV